MSKIHLIKVNDIDLDGFAPLLSESISEGHRCLETLQTDWVNGQNRFNKTGEFYLAAYKDETLAGLCGLNIDPYLQQDRVGRVRHLFVTQRYRRSGVASFLIQDIMRRAEAEGAFDVLRLRIPKGSETANLFYISQGFSPIEGDEFCTHIFKRGLT